MSNTRTNSARNFQIQISTEESINVDKGEFNGDVQAAIKFIECFCSTNQVTIRSYGHGYGTLMVNNEMHNITPYGIDLVMMIGFCKGSVDGFRKKAESISPISVFKHKCPTIVQRRTDMLTVVEINDIATTNANEISAAAAKQPNFPQYKSDGVGAILIFHTENGEFVLGGARDNPAIENELTKLPQQINATIGGYLAYPELSLRKAVIEAIKNKMFLTVEISEGAPGFEEQKTLKQLCLTLANNDGWEKVVCVHTDKWDNKDGTQGTMCFLTAIKHMSCSHSELTRIDEALQTIMGIKKTEGANLRTLSAFKFVSLQPIITKSLATHLQDEITKAETVAVTFNDLAVATLAKNGAFKSTSFAHLDLACDALPKNKM